MKCKNKGCKHHSEDWTDHCSIPGQAIFKCPDFQSEDIPAAPEKCTNQGCHNYQELAERNCRTWVGLTKCWWIRNVSTAEGEPKSAAQPEPMPTGNGDVVILDLIQDLLARDKMGRKKYHTSLKTNNGRDAMMDAFQEALDLCMYLKQAIMERDAK